MESISNSSKHKNKAKQSKVGKFIQDKFGIYRYMGVRNLWLKKTRTLISILSNYTLWIFDYLHFFKYARRSR